MQRAILSAALALLIGLLLGATEARAQNPQPRDRPPEGLDVPPRAASPSGARYIPGVGFRFVPPIGGFYGYYRAPRVLGYYADRETMRYRRHYRPASCDVWRGERCPRRWH
jgi:hypothetical protein